MGRAKNSQRAVVVASRQEPDVDGGAGELTASSASSAAPDGKPSGFCALWGAGRGLHGDALVQRTAEIDADPLKLRRDAVLGTFPVAPLPGHKFVAPNENTRWVLLGDARNQQFPRSTDPEVLPGGYDIIGTVTGSGDENADVDTLRTLLGRETEMVALVDLQEREDACVRLVSPRRPFESLSEREPVSLDEIIALHHDSRRKK